ncbi:MAG: hypothetical protein GY777_14725 [Candidatus Brocadiaceae bacterium]|nr:hypothetical protein [Candidatus Brocadiaceae bacterium]
MNIKSSNSVNKVKRNYFIYLVCVNLVSVSLLLVVLFSSKREDAIANIIIGASLTWLPINVMFAILYLRIGSLKSLSTIKSFDAMGERDRKNLIKAAVLLCITTALEIVVIIKGAVLIGCVLMCISLFAYFYYQKRLLRKSKRTELEGTTC